MKKQELIPKEIQDLVLTKDEDNIRLAVDLIGDFKLLWAWSSINEFNSLKHGLPYICDSNGFTPIRKALRKYCSDSEIIHRMYSIESEQYLQEKLREHAGNT